MQFPSRLIPLALLVVVASCDVSTSIGGSEARGDYVVANAFTAPVDVLVDGNVVIAGLPTGSVTDGTVTLGSHTLALRGPRRTWARFFGPSGQAKPQIGERRPTESRTSAAKQPRRGRTSRPFMGGRR